MTVRGRNAAVGSVPVSLRRWLDNGGPPPPAVGAARVAGIRPRSIADRGRNTGRWRTSCCTLGQGIGEAGDLPWTYGPP